MFACFFFFFFRFGHIKKSLLEEHPSVVDKERRVAFREAGRELNVFRFN